MSRSTPSIEGGVWGTSRLGWGRRGVVGRIGPSTLRTQTGLLGEVLDQSLEYSTTPISSSNVRNRT